MKKVPLLVLTAVLFSLYFLIVREEKVRLPSLHQNGDSFLEGLRIVHKKDGQKDWIVTAKRADIKENGDMAELSDLEVTVQDKDVTISAGRGTYDMAGKKLTIIGPVTAKEKEYTMTSEDMEFENSTGILKTDRQVRIEGKKFLLTGKGLYADNNEKKVRVLKDVKATFYN
jgi:LPS export ABC transporter protein LptC